MSSIDSHFNNNIGFREMFRQCKITSFGPGNNDLLHASNLDYPALIFGKNNLNTNGNTSNANDTAIFHSPEGSNRSSGR
jgi:hypothetical protein